MYPRDGLGEAGIAEKTAGKISREGETMRWLPRKEILGFDVQTEAGD